MFSTWNIRWILEQIFLLVYELRSVSRGRSVPAQVAPCGLISWYRLLRTPAQTVVRLSPGSMSLWLGGGPISRSILVWDCDWLVWTAPSAGAGRPERSRPWDAAPQVIAARPMPTIWMSQKKGIRPRVSASLASRPHTPCGHAVPSPTRPHRPARPFACHGTRRRRVAGKEPSAESRKRRARRRESKAAAPPTPSPARVVQANGITRRNQTPRVEETAASGPLGAVSRPPQY